MFDAKKKLEMNHQIIFIYSAYLLYDCLVTSRSVNECLTMTYEEYNWSCKKCRLKSHEG